MKSEIFNHNSKPSYALMSTISGHAEMKRFRVTSSPRMCIARCIVRNSSNRALSNHCYKEPEIRTCMIKKTGSILRKEIKNMCATKTCSKFRCSSIHDLESFKWTELLNDMKINAPTLTSILNACMHWYEEIQGK